MLQKLQRVLQANPDFKPLMRLLFLRNIQLFLSIFFSFINSWFCYVQHEKTFIKKNVNMIKILLFLINENVRLQFYFIFKNN